MTDLRRVHRERLERFRHSMNLIGPGPVDEHFEDSDAALAWVAPRGRWVDLGSGAGFPGLPFAAAHPALEVVLVDSRKKRCGFLSLVVEEAGEQARVAVRCARVEDLEGPFDGVISRAFAPPDQVLTHAARLLAPGGVVVLFLQADGAVPVHPRFQVFHVEPYTVAGKRRRSVGLRFT